MFSGEVVEAGIWFPSNSKADYTVAQDGLDVLSYSWDPVSLSQGCHCRTCTRVTKFHMYIKDNQMGQWMSGRKQVWKPRYFTQWSIVYTSTTA